VVFFLQASLLKLRINTTSLSFILFIPCTPSRVSSLLAAVLRIVKMGTNECELSIKCLRLILKQIASNYFKYTQKPQNLHQDRRLEISVIYEVQLNHFNSKNERNIFLSNLPISQTALLSVKFPDLTSLSFC
jgi:hypothetical protein